MANNTNTQGTVPEIQVRSNLDRRFEASIWLCIWFLEQIFGYICILSAQKILLGKSKDVLCMILYIDTEPVSGTGLSIHILWFDSVFAIADLYYQHIFNS